MVRYGILVAVFGMLGILFTFIDTQEGIGGKIPLTLFFILIIIIGILFEVLPKSWVDETFGEVNENKEFG